MWASFGCVNIFLVSLTVKVMSATLPSPQVDVFDLRLVRSVGIIKSIKIRSDGSGIGNSWHVDSVLVGSR